VLPYRTITGAQEFPVMANAFQLAERITRLPARKQVALFEALGPWLWRMELATGEQATLEELREARFSRGVVCPHCDSAEVQGWGRTGGKRGTGARVAAAPSTI
jgi:hypothetical protein